MTFGYLVVEGTHDVAFIGRLLRTFGLRRVKLLKHLQPFWKPLVPPTFPFKDDLLKRVPVPAFFEGADHSVAVDSAVGVARLTPALEETLAQLGSARSELRSIGMFLDADWSKKPSDVFDELKAKLEFFGVVMPAAPGMVAQGSIRTGIYIFPDNQSSGTLETLLDECALAAYPGLRAAGRNLVDGINRAQLTRDDLQELAAPSGEVKAVMGCISSVLKPMRAIQNSIEDNRWVSDKTLTLANVQSVKNFLEQLLLQ